MMRRFITILAALWFLSAYALAQSGELRFSLHHEPKTFNPLQADSEDASETVRYLTGGVLVRLNRASQELEPALATSWNVTDGGRTITFVLRDRVFFSDGTPFTAEDVAFTVRQLMDPALHSPTADQFRTGSGTVEPKVHALNRIGITFPAPVVGLEKLFDQVVIMSARSPKKEMAVLGPFYVADYKAGSYVLLQRNPNYWKKDAAGRQLPYLEFLRLDIQPNREAEALRFRRREIHMINSLEAEYFDRLATVCMLPGLALILILCGSTRCRTLRCRHINCPGSVLKTSGAPFRRRLIARTCAGWSTTSTLNPRSALFLRPIVSGSIPA
jgi:ABC-type transport system substrate-binding protein